MTNIVYDLQEQRNLHEELCVVIRPEILKNIEDTEETVTEGFEEEVAKMTGKSSEELKNILNQEKEYDIIEPL